MATSRGRIVERKTAKQAKLKLQRTMEHSKLKNWRMGTFRIDFANNGWSILEVMIALAAITLIFVVSSPAINTLSLKYQLSRTSTDLRSSLLLAQTEAREQRGITRICPSSDGSSCRLDGDWNRGWVVYLDHNLNGKMEASELLERNGPANENVRIHGLGTLANHASFNTAGEFELETETEVSDGEFMICKTNGESGHYRILLQENGFMEPTKSDMPCSEM